jgi:hypothetical protein
MGLHLSFELRLDAATDANVAHAKLAELHAHASTLQLAALSPFLSPASADSDERREELAGLQDWASIVTSPGDDDLAPLTVDTSTALGFFVHPGDGCESASFGLLRRATASGVPADWYWQCSCKTQYASAVSDAHLIVCHTSLVSILDVAVQIGFQVDVFDETHYWETRDASALLREVHSMNRIVAAFAGRLSDVLGGEHRLEAPIFAHPRFEHLEMGEGEGEGE